MAVLSIQITHHAETPKHNTYKRHDKLGYSSICYIGSKIRRVSMREVYKLFRGDPGKLTYSTTIRYILTSSACGA